LMLSDMMRMVMARCQAGYHAAFVVTPQRYYDTSTSRHSYHCLRYVTFVLRGARCCYAHHGRRSPPHQLVTTTSSLITVITPVAIIACRLPAAHAVTLPLPPYAAVAVVIPVYLRLICCWRRLMLRVDIKRYVLSYRTRLATTPPTILRCSPACCRLPLPRYVERRCRLYAPLQHYAII